jgi:endo-1,4-beta-D-glucanase Y
MIYRPSGSLPSIFASTVVAAAATLGLLASGCSSAHSGTGGAGGAPTGSSGGASGTGGSHAAAGGAGGGSGGAGIGGGTGIGGAAGIGGAGGAGSGGSALCATAALSSTAAARLASEYQSWKTTYVRDCPTTSSAAVISGGNSVVSEGIGYGMLLSVLNNDQPLFDKLWKFYSDHLDPRGLMNWSMDACVAPGNNNANSATDGDLDAAMGLVLADARWTGYTTATRTLIANIKLYETDSCSGLNVLRPGDKFGGCSDTSPNNMGKVNPSYFAPGYYRVFATVDTANAAFWIKLAADSYTLLAQYQATMAGLVPEWGFVNGTTESNPTYGYNACRTPRRVAVDYLWFCTPQAATFLQGISTYVDGHGGVAGVPFDKNSAFLGAFALSAMPLGQTKLDAYVASWLGAPVDDMPYFQATLRRLYLHAAAGQFTPPAPPP